MSTSTMSAVQAAEILQHLESYDVRCWVVGGWGVDALLGRETRAHHDLDLLVLVDDLPALAAWQQRHGFTWRYDWDENRPVDVEGERFSTAYVAAHEDGRELDVHAVRLVDGIVELATTDPWSLPEDTLTGRGTIGGTDVACASREAQAAMHRGYELPAHHVADLVALGLR